MALIDRFCRWIYRQAAHLVVLSPGFQEHLDRSRRPGGEDHDREELVR